MRLLMTADAVGGVWTYATDLAAGLAAQGAQVILVLLGPDPPVAPELAGVEVVRTGLPLDWTATGYEALEVAGRRLARLANEVEADLVHLNSPALAGAAAFDVPVLGACHSCLATWWSAVKGGEPPPDFRWRIQATAAGYAACDALVAPSAAFAAATAAAYGLRPAVVLNGRAPPPPGRETGRSGVVTAGRLWDEGKDAATFDAMAGHLSASVTAYGATVGPLGQWVELDHAHAMGAKPSASLRTAFSRARIFVSTAIYEPFGLSVLEAAQAGCALVLSDIATFRELWSDAAVFVPPRDAPAFARAVQRLLDDEDACTLLAEAAQRRATRYGRDAMVVGAASLHAAMLAPAQRQVAGAP